MRIILLNFILFSLAGCMNIGTNTSYNNDLTASDSVSETINLSFTNTKFSPYYLVLMSKNNNGEIEDFLKVRWINLGTSGMQSHSLKSSIKFIVNKEKVITLMPMKMPVLKGFDLNKKAYEEEIIYKISREDIKEIAYASSVEVELTGKNKVVMGKFNKWHSFYGFKNFLANT